MENITISVVLAAYNGGKYITEQLESIRCQTRKPDEVLIFDDKSNDGTPEIVEEYIAMHKISNNWKLYRNDLNQGWQRNFYKGVSKANGEIIFFSDQDDVWLPEKIENMSKIMEKKPIGCVYCGYEFIDRNGNVISGAKYRKIVAKTDLIERFNTVVTMGCRMCISREIANVYLAVNAPEYSYDSQCGRLAVLYSEMETIPEIGIMYRIHDSNTSMVDSSIEAGSSTLENRIKDIEENIRWLEKLLEYDRKNKNGIRELLIKDYMTFQMQRLEYLKKQRGIGSLSIGKRYYRDVSMMIGDFAYRHELNKIFGKIAMMVRKKRICHH